jgi:hypothetical protein
MLEVCDMRTRLALFQGCAVLLVVLAMVAATNAATITNPSFEADGYMKGAIGYGWGDPKPVTGWTPGGDKFTAFDCYLAATLSLDDPTQAGVADNGKTPDGTHVGFLMVYPGVSKTTFSTTVTDLVVGQQYQLTYYENARVGAATPMDVSVAMNGTKIVASHSLTPVEGQGYRDKDYYFVTSDAFTATATSEILAFTQLGDGRDAMWLIDNVQVNRVVPEPSSLALVASGLAGLAVCVWRRRRS